MAVSYMDFTSPNVQYFYDLKNNRTFTKDANNFINALGIQQLNTLGNVSLLDIYLSKGNVVEPHVHQNASELVYCIQGAAVVSILNPFTKMVLNFNITPGQVANIPQGGSTGKWLPKTIRICSRSSMRQYRNSSRYPTSSGWHREICSLIHIALIKRR